MKQYKWITVILTGILVTSMVMVGYHVWASNRKIAGYNVDSDYVSKEQNTETSSSNTDIASEAGKDTIETKDESNDTADTSEASTDSTQETIRDEEEGKNDQIAVSEPHEGKDPIDIDNEDNKPSGEEVEQTSGSDSTDQSVSTDNGEPSKPDDQESEEEDYTGHEWVDETINENREDIVDADLEEGLSIGDKIDDDILLGYLDGGLTQEERADLKEYLEVVLSAEEMSKLDALFNKYNYMFQ